MKKRTQGMNWISQKKRLAIYMRDGLSCVYCGSSVEDGVKLTLDHLKPYSKGGDNKETNLVTCCLKCNASRGTRPVKTFCDSVSNYINTGIAGNEIEKHVRNCAKRLIKKYLVEAADLIERRGSVAKVLNNKLN